MATAARAIIQQALATIGAYTPGEEIQPADSDIGLIWLQNQLDAFAADRLWLNVQTRVTATIPSGTTQMTIGTGGDINTTRPVFITGINYLIPGANPPVETPMGRMDDDSYMNLSIKTLSSSLPTQFYYNETFPLGTLNFWPQVSQNVSIALYIPQQTISATTLDSVVQGPPGYMEAFIYQLALRLTLPFGKQVPPLLPEAASQALARAKRQNMQPGLLGVDAALVPMNGAGYNILNDTHTGGGAR
jgi:hypothetical protein